MTALSLVSKGDLAFLCEPAGGGAASVIVDVSEQRTNLTNNTTYCTEANSARTAIAAPRTICVVVDMTTGSSGFLVHHGTSAAAYKYAISKSGTNICLSENAAVILTVAVPGLAAAARKFLIHWAQRPDGAFNFNECVIYNFATAAWVFGSVTATAITPVSTDTFTIGATTTGTSAYSLGMTAFYTVAVGRRFHSTTESVIDHVAVPTPPSMPGRRRTPRITGASTDLTIAGDGNFAGPQYLSALAATRDADARLLTPLVNLVVANPYTELVTPVTRYNRTAPGAVNYRLSTRWLWHAWPGPQCNAARVRIHVAVTGTGSVCPIQFRMYSLANLPVGQPKPPPLVYYFSPTVQIAASTGAAGAWLDLGQVRLARDDAGMTYLALALSFNNGGADIYTTNVKVRAVTVEPLSADLTGGGYGDQNDKKKA